MNFAYAAAQMRKLAEAEPAERERIVAHMCPADMMAMDVAFENWAHENQLPPGGEGWRTWLMMAGRGFGKTRAGAEWINGLAMARPEARIALVAASLGEARAVMVEGVSGILAVARNHRRRVTWEPSIGRLTWPNGSMATIFSGDHPDGLRGPEHDFAWCDELAKWRDAEAAWDNLQLSLRRGRRPRALVTTTAAISRTAGLEPHSGEVGGALSSDALDERDLSVGRWNGAFVQLRLIDWREPAQEPIILMSGELGDIGVADDAFTAELRGGAAKLDRPVCPSTSAECRAQFGDKQCRVDLAGRTMVATVVSAAGDRLTLDGPVDERFLFGRLRYLDGANCGMATIILAVDGNELRVRDLPRGESMGGERVELREGCDKRLETCATRFANATNFRGEPHLPGNDLLTRYPGA